MADFQGSGVNINAQREEVAQWARTGKVRYARWDGGVIESAKAILSGWYYITDPKALEATTNWYEGDHSLELLLAANINWIWVTFSTGFSLETERPAQKQLAHFVRRCHDFGIRVTAYMSMDNIFVDDMRENEPNVEQWLQRNLEGRPIPYGAAKYTGEPTRLLACLNHPEWRNYLAKRINLALDMGFDGLEYDNQWTDCRCPRCTDKWQAYQRKYSLSDMPWPEDPAVLKLLSEEQMRLTCIYDHYRISEYEEIYRLVREIAMPRNPNALIYGNFNSGYNTFTLPSNSAVSTEDGYEPGIVDGRLVHNVGLLRCLSGAGAGWRPIRIEDSIGRGKGQRSRYIPMDAVKHQLSMAEAHSFGASLQITPEGEFLRDLYFRTPEAMENWTAIARYNRFFAVHEELYANVTTAANIVSLHHAGCHRISGGGLSQRLELIGGLASRGVILDVRYDQDMDPELLKPYNVMLLADMCSISDKVLKLIREFSGRGGKIVATGLTGWYDEHFIKLERNALEDIPNVLWLQDPSKNVMKGLEITKQTNFIDQFSTDSEENLDSRLMDELAQALLHLASSPVKIECPQYVLYNLTYDMNGHFLIHFLNYDERQRPQITVHFNTDIPVSVEWLTPDENSSLIEWKETRTIHLNQMVNYGVLRCRRA